MKLLFASVACGVLLAAGTAGAASTPTPPAGLALKKAGLDRVALSWRRSPGAISYAVYRDGVLVGRTRAASYTVRRLKCGTRYRLQVEAVGRKQAASRKAALAAETSLCPDATPPSAPAGMGARGASRDGLTVSWQPATDDVGVTGYDLFVDGQSAGAETGTSHAFAGLACGIRYTFAVAAHDRSGKRSGQTVLRDWTSPCAPNLFVAPTGNDGAQCTATAPCASFGRAFGLARAGQVVEVAGGTYPPQTIAGDRGGRVILQAAPGANVVVGGEVTVSAKHLELRRMSFGGGWQAMAGADDLTFRDVNAGGMFIFSASNVRVIGGAVGPGVNYHPMIAATDGSSVPPRNVLIDGVSFHDWTRTSPDVHIECLQIGAGDGITIRNSTFRNCHVFALAVTQFGLAGPPRNLTIENNFFDRGGDGGFYSILFSGFASSWENVLLRNNSLLQAISIDPGPPKVNFRLVANIAPLQPWECVGGIDYEHNVWENVACGPTDVKAPSGYANPAAFDLHLTAGAAAIDHGDPANAPAMDIDGQLWTAGGAPDAGADEASSGTAPKR